MSAANVEASMEWTGGLSFKGTAGGREIQLDGNREKGCSPMEALLLSFAGCMAIDLVHILGKRRAELTAVRAELAGDRAESEPRRYTAIRLHFVVRGKGFESEHVTRAIELSREKYCSVWNSLRDDIVLEITHELAR